MKSNKPITFTTKLIFYDKEGQQFPIQVAGTVDNCLFTNYSFFQRTERDSIEFVMDKDLNSINLRKIQNKDTDDPVNDSKMNGSVAKDDDKKSDKQNRIENNIKIVKNEEKKQVVEKKSSSAFVWPIKGNVISSFGNKSLLVSPTFFGR